MALNLWTTNGKPSSYIPFPNVTQSYPNLDIGQYVFSFYAYSPSNAIFRIGGQNNNLTANGAHPYNITLSQTRTLYTVNVINTSVQSFQILDANNIGDIVIDSISLTKAPLAKNTINGVDGFLSGKWVNGGGGNGTCNYIINTDNSLTIQSRDGIWKGLTLDIPVIPNTKYVFSVSFLSSVNNGLNFRVDSLDNNKSFSSTLVNGGYSQSAIQQGVSFTSSNSYIRIFLQTPSIEDLTLSNLMLNLGSIPAPYEPKRGDKMVLPTPKKNFIPSVSNFILESVGSLERENISDTKLRLKTLDGAVKYVDYSFDSLPNKQYTVSVGVNDGNMPVYSYNGSGYTVLATLSGEMKSATFTTPSDCKKIKINCETKTVVGDYFFDQIQLEQGTSATPFAPYAVQVNPKPKRAIASAKSGLAFNGGYITVPLQSPQTFSYVFDFSLPSNYTSEQLIYSRDFGQSNGITTVYNKVSIVNGKIRFTVATNSGTFDVNSNGIFNDGLRHHVVCSYDGFITKIFVDGVLDVSSNSISGSVSYSSLNTIGYIGNDSTGGNFRLFMGTLFNFKLLDGNGVLIFNYDFTNPRTVTGTTVLTNGNTNLLPSFDSGQWSIASTAKVMGRDVLHLDAAGAWNESTALIPFIVGKTYQMVIGSLFASVSYGYYIVRCYDSSNNVLTSGSITSLNGNPSTTFTVPSNTASIKVFFGSSTSGAFDFIRPQLYLLNGNEGTINGAPTNQSKFARRRLYAKR